MRLQEHFNTSKIYLILRNINNIHGGKYEKY